MTVPLNEKTVIDLANACAEEYGVVNRAVQRVLQFHVAQHQAGTPEANFFLFHSLRAQPVGFWEVPVQSHEEAYNALIDCGILEIVEKRVPTLELFGNVEHEVDLCRVSAATAVRMGLN